MDEEFDRIADLPDNGARQKETYARFGLAAYWAQVFETGMVSLIAVATAYASRTGTPMTTADIDATYSAIRAGDWCAGWPT